MDENIIELINGIRCGNDNSFSILAEQYNSLLEASVKKFLPSFNNCISDNAYDMDDLKQYASLALYKAAETYDPYSDKKGKAVTFGLYAKICVNNALISLLRKYRSQARKKRKYLNSDTSKQSPLDFLIQGEEAKLLKEEILNILSKYETQVFTLYIDGKSTDEIASKLNKSSKSVSNALFRIRVKIRELMKI